MVAFSPDDKAVDEIRQEDRRLAGIVYLVGGLVCVAMAGVYGWLIYHLLPKRHHKRDRQGNRANQPLPPHKAIRPLG